MSIREKVERSSLGTDNARAARRTVPTATAARVVARAAALPARVEAKKNLGGERRRGTYT
jgi:hypothetical protein